MGSNLHIAVIMDGNRRFSKKLLTEPWKGHEYGAKKFRQIIEWCKEIHATTLTVYAFSWENFNRPQKEFDYLMELFDKEITELLTKANDILKEDIKIRFVGRINRFPESLYEKMCKLQEITSSAKKYTVNICMAYSGRNEIIDTIVELHKEKKLSSDFTADDLLKSLSINSEPDIIIRTGGERRLSNFLPFQSVYSELFFTETLWPDFSKEEFMNIVEEFKSRQRRFGK
ncbi:MAG: polyprenyl diphosphate synthase [Candidatus Woesearchaeota archaeon]